MHLSTNFLFYAFLRPAGDYQSFHLFSNSALRHRFFFCVFVRLGRVFKQQGIAHCHFVLSFPLLSYLHPTHLSPHALSIPFCTCIGIYKQEAGSSIVSHSVARHPPLAVCCTRVFFSSIPPSHRIIHGTTTASAASIQIVHNIHIHTHTYIHTFACLFACFPFFASHSWLLHSLTSPAAPKSDCHPQPGSLYY